MKFVCNRIHTNVTDMKKLFLIVMACYGLNARSQVSESRNFLHLYPDSTVYANRIRLRPDLSGNWLVRADYRRIPVERIKFFNNEDGFFANTRKLNFFGEVSFAERIIEGRINLYQQVIYNPVPFEADYYRFRDRTSKAINTKMFYNKGLTDLKKVNYRNLKADMADNQKSIDLLENYRKSIRTGNIIYVAAGAAVVAGAINLFAGSGFNHTGSAFGRMSSYGPKGYTEGVLLMGLGGVLGLGGYLVQASGSKYIERAIETYNR